jgi:hypothetical protein
MAAFATGVPLDINAFHRYTENSAILSCTQAPQFRMPFHRFRWDFTSDIRDRLRTLYAQ